MAGRREDRLVFDLQTAVADSFGYQSTHKARSSEQLMHRYYWAAKAVTQLNQILMLNIEERINRSEAAPMRRINAVFYDRGGMLEVARDDLYTDNPHAILETFLVFAQSPGIQRAVGAHAAGAVQRARGDGQRVPPRPGQPRAVHGPAAPAAGHHARLPADEPDLGAGPLPVGVRRIVGRMQHDLFHVYTVDQHILMVLRNVRRFFIPEHAHEYPFCSQLALDWDQPWLLYVAALFHDVAKGRGGDHSQLGAAEVRRFCRDHGVDREDAALIEFLVKHHLTMSTVAQKEDLSDPDVIRNFASKVGDVRRLTALYLLTVADIRGTSPKVWNAWKGKLLEDLYRITLRALGGAKPNLDADLEARRQEARQILALHSALPGTEAPLWKTLELSYFARHDASEIAWHARSLWRHIDSSTPVVQARPSPIGEGLQVLVYAPDQADLFVRICGYFRPRRLLDPGRQGAHQPHRLCAGHLPAGAPRLRARRGPRRAGRLLPRPDRAGGAPAGAGPGSTAPLPEPSRGRVSRRVKSFPVVPRVSLRPDERAQRWLLSVSTSDRSGLLYAIARVLANHHINLQLAKVTTLGERVEDTFLVNGPALQQTRAQLQIETELLDAVAPLR